MLSLIGLQGWERERVSDALILLTFEPRPRPFAEELEGVPGEALRVSIGEREAHYKVYKGATNDDIGVVVFAVS